LKGALVELTLGQSTLQSWVFVAEITDEFIQELTACELATTCYNWDENRCRYGVQEHDHVHPVSLGQRRGDAGSM
jgi:hypothetical protein